jgi:hypothetical protein
MGLLTIAEIRKDIFTNMQPFIGDKERFFEMLNIPKENQEAFLENYIKGYRQDKLWVFVNEGYQGISSQFKSENELVAYINSFTDAETAELFIEICKFYAVAKKHQQSSTVKLIMIFSIIEKLIIREKGWKEFHSWIFHQRPLIQEHIDNAKKMDQKVFLKIIEDLKEQYFKEYGSQRNVVEFFKKYVTPEDQFKLIKAFRANYAKVIENNWSQDLTPFETIEQASATTKMPIEERMMPYCFNWKKCLVDYGDCDHSDTCELNNKLLLEETLKKVVNDIYQLRNDFVHSASITPLNEYDASDAKNSAGFVVSVIGSKDKPIIISITIQEFERIFEQAIKKYFDSIG